MDCRADSSEVGVEAVAENGQEKAGEKASASHGEVNQDRGGVFRLREMIGPEVRGS